MKKMNKEISLSTAQAIQAWWEKGVVPEATPSSRLERFLEEVAELKELDGQLFDERCKEPLFAREVGLETIDCIIIGLGLIHALGLNADNLFAEKMHINHLKYGLEKVRELVEKEGISYTEARDRLKKEWNEKKIDLTS